MRATGRDCRTRPTAHNALVVRSKDISDFRVVRFKQKRTTLKSKEQIESRKVKRHLYREVAKAVQKVIAPEKDYKIANKKKQD